MSKRKPFNVVSELNRLYARLARTSDLAAAAHDYRLFAAISELMLRVVKQLSKYEPRPDQRTMAGSIAKALRESRRCAVEPKAPTL